MLLNPAVALLGADTLVLAADPQHKYLRGLLTPAFSNDAINRYAPGVQRLQPCPMLMWPLTMTSSNFRSPTKTCEAC